MKGKTSISQNILHGLGFSHSLLFSTILGCKAAHEPKTMKPEKDGEKVRERQAGHTEAGGRHRHRKSHTALRTASTEQRCLQKMFSSSQEIYQSLNVRKNNKVLISKNYNQIGSQN